MSEPSRASSRLAVVTVTYSPGEHLREFLDSLATATTERPLVILADNGSTDGAPEAAAQRHDHVRLLRTGGNIGYGGAANRGVAELDDTVEWVLVANPDVAFLPGSVDELLAAAARWPRAAALGPLIREPDGSIYPSAREVPTILAGSGHAVLTNIWPGNPWSRSYRRPEEQPGERPAGWLSGSCLLLRRSVFDQLGGFDSRYFMYFEDVDLGDRITRAGWHNVYVPTAVVTHAQGHAASKAPTQMLTAHHDSAYRFLADRHPGRHQAPLRGALRLALRARNRWATR